MCIEALKISRDCREQNENGSTKSAVEVWLELKMLCKSVVSTNQSNSLHKKALRSIYKATQPTRNGLSRWIIDIGFFWKKTNEPKWNCKVFQAAFKYNSVYSAGSKFKNQESNREEFRIENHYYWVDKKCFKILPKTTWQKLIAVFGYDILSI